MFSTASYVGDNGLGFAMHSGIEAPRAFGFHRMNSRDITGYLHGSSEDNHIDTDL